MSARTKAILLVFFVSIIVYSNSLGGEFVWDDEYFVVKNTAVRSLANFPEFFANPSAIAFGGLAKDVYRPITGLSYAFDFLSSRLNAFGYHLTNVLFHSFDAILVFLLIYLISKDMVIALFTSLFFACHPVQTETVSWISGRASVLFLFFYLLSFILYIKSLDRPDKIFPVLSLGSFALALFSKEMAVTLPLVLILYDIHFVRDGAIRKRVGLYASYFILVIFFLAARSLVLGRLSQIGWWGGNPYYTFLTMPGVLVRYIEVLLLPVELCAFYAIPVSRSIAENGVVTSIVLVSIIIGALPFIFRRSRSASFAISWFLVTMLPVSNIVPLKALMAERFLYLPSIGFCLLVAIAIKRISVLSFRKRGIYIAVAAMSLVVLAYSFRTMARNEEWKAAASISESIIKVSPLNPWGFTSLGTAQIDKGDYEGAVKSLKKAIALAPDHPTAHNVLGFCYLEISRYEDAKSELEKAVKSDPDNVEARNSLGTAYANLKRYDEAETQFKAGIEGDAYYISAHLNLGALYESKGEFDKALAQYDKILSIAKYPPDLAVAHIRMGDVYKKEGLKDKARVHYDEALAVCGNNFPEIRKLAEERMR